MSRELDLLAREFSKKPCTVLRRDLNLYGKNLRQEMAGFAKEVEKIAKKSKQGNVTIVAAIFG
jgi:hypothetical protein